MHATLINLSSEARTHWAVVTFPAALAKDFGAECSFRTSTGNVWRAVRGVTEGCKTVYRILCKDMQHAVVGELINEQHEAVRPFHFHPWVSDQFAALLPKMLAYRDGKLFVSKVEGDPVLVRIDGAHMRWKLRLRIAELGLALDWWTDIYSDDAVMNCWGKIVWSDRNDRSYNRGFDAIGLASKEGFLLDFAQRHGAHAPLLSDGEWTTTLNSAPMLLQDGAALPLSGVMLCTPSETSTELDSWRDVRAAMRGPIVGVCHDWDGHWLAGKNVPRLPDFGGRDAEWTTFQNAMTVPAGWFSARPLGLNQTPSQTGDQEDFGATKGTYVVSHLDPRHIRVMQYSAYSEAFRGTSLLEANGQPLRAEAHPDWVTWDGVTHYHPGVSKDRLNKLTVGPAGNGWNGYDDEHRSQNNIAVYAALTDDPLAADLIERQLVVDQASYRSRYPNLGQGAARAQGRLAGAWAQLFSVTGDTRWRDLIVERARRSLEIPSMQRGPMRALAVGGPDARKPIYRNEQLAPWVSLWEHGLAAVGLYNAFKATNREPVRQLLEHVCRTLVAFGCYDQNGKWYTVGDIRWDNGDAPPMEDGTRTAGAQAGGVLSWTFYGLLVAREVLPDETAHLTPYFATVPPAQTRRDAEWRAAVRE